MILFSFLSWRYNPLVGQGLLIHEVSRSHTTTHHSRQNSSGRVISSSQRPLPDNTQHSQQTDIHAPPRGIRNHDLSRQGTVDLGLRPRGHWDRHHTNNTAVKISIHFKQFKKNLGDSDSGFHFSCLLLSCLRELGHSCTHTTVHVSVS